MENDRSALHLKDLVDKLTTSGKDKLDEEKFKKVKKICKQSNIYVIELYKLVSKQLKKNHAEIRLSAFQVCNEIFCRSHCFRELLLKDFLQVANLVLGLDPDVPLPKPEAVARKLKQMGVETIQKWHDQFSEGYFTLTRGYDYLKDCKKVDFAELTARTEAERQRAEEDRIRAEEIKTRKVDKVKNELEESSQEINDCLLQFQNCFKLLIPDVHDFFIPLSDESVSKEGGFLPKNENEVAGGGFLVEEHEEEEEEEEEEDTYGSEFMRGHGIMKETTVQVNLEDVRKVQETTDNEIVIGTLKECISVLKTKLLPKIRKWEEVIKPYTEGNVSLIKAIIDYKTSVQSSVKKFESLNIVEKSTKDLTASVGCDSDDDDDDFVEVPLDDPRVVSAAASEAALLGMAQTAPHHSLPVQPHDPNNEPSCSGIKQASPHCSHQGSSSSRKSNCVTSPDEYINKGTPAPKRLSNPLAGLSQVWTATAELHEQEEMQCTGGVLGIATQRVNYERMWEPVKWACRAPLKSGQLCPRRDRDKCPFHGPIIPRDEAGKPLRPEDAAREQAAKEQYERDNPPWQDPQLLAELKAATGVDLKLPKGRQKRKRKYENLTDLQKTTPRERLKKKIFHPKTVKRVDLAFAKETRSAPNTSVDFKF